MCLKVKDACGAYQHHTQLSLRRHASFAPMFSVQLFQHIVVLTITNSLCCLHGPGGVPIVQLQQWTKLPVSPLHRIHNHLQHNAHDSHNIGGVFCSFQAVILKLNIRQGVLHAKVTGCVSAIFAEFREKVFLLTVYFIVNQ